MSKKYKLKPYICHEGEQEEYAILVFAKTWKEARKIGWRAFEAHDEYIYFKTELLRDAEYIYEQADQKLFAEGVSHVADPVSCDTCYQWGRRKYTKVGNKTICDYCNDE